MDYWDTLRELYEERRRLDKVIRNLEELLRCKNPAAFSTRGRKSMPADERKQVSERMRKYWESRRKANSSAEK